MQAAQPLAEGYSSACVWLVPAYPLPYVFRTFLAGVKLGKYMYELGHILLLFWRGPVRVIGGQRMEESPGVATQFFPILWTVLPKLDVPLLLGPHPRLEVHAGPARSLPVLQTLRRRGRGRGGVVSMPCAAAPRVSHQVVGHLGARAARQEGEATAAREARRLAGRRHLAGVRAAGPRGRAGDSSEERARHRQRAAAGAGTAARG